MSNLANRSDRAQPFAGDDRRSSVTRGAGDGAPFDSTPSATSANLPESPGFPGTHPSNVGQAESGEGDPGGIWWDDYQASWLTLTESQRKHWDKRAKAKRLEPAQRSYADRRARAMSMDIRARIAECGERCAVIRCGCRRVVKHVGCRQRWLCDDCRRRYARGLRRRLHRSCRTWTRAARGERRSWRLMTFTPPAHTGELAADRERIRAAWRKFHKWLSREVGGAFPYALVWEVTPGRDGKGHVHAHCVALLPFFDYGRALDVWRAAVGRADAQWDCKRASKGAGGAAEYVSKYASKGTNAREFTPGLAAQVSAAFYGKRLVTASQGFWFRPPPECRSCGELYQLEVRPGNLPGALPWEQWRATARRKGVKANRVGWIDGYQRELPLTEVGSGHGASHEMAPPARRRLRHDGRPAAVRR